MPWLKLLHGMALLAWCATLLYLPLLIAFTEAQPDGSTQPEAPLARKLFITLATPMALLAIFSGTALFLRDNIVEGWLILKLTAVAGLVLCHALCGVVLVKAETDPRARVRLPCLIIGAASALLILSILGLVLGRPVLERI